MKFRVYDKVLNKYAERNLFLNQEGKVVAVCWGMEETENLDPDRFILEMSTGLKDKNGVEIFQNDKCLAKLPDAPYEKGETVEVVVEYDESSCRYELCEYKKGGLWNNYPIHDDIILQIIGNIHEQAKP